MRKLLLALLLPLAILFAPSARADEPAASTPTLEVGARAGLTLPFGSSVSRVTLGDSVAAQAPIQLDLGVRLMPNLFVGAYGSYGLVFPSDKACNAVSCSGGNFRVGIQAHYHFLPGGNLDPWIGVGAGYEWLDLKASQAGLDESVTLRGFELLNLQAGLDWKIGHFGVGPYAALSMGEYSKLDATFTLRQETSAVSADVPSSALHEWVTLGVRGTFDL